LPQAPQFATSVSVEMHAPLQGTSGETH